MKKNLVLIISTLVLLLNAGCAIVEGGGYAGVYVTPNTGYAVNSRGIPYGYYPYGTVTTIDASAGVFCARPRAVVVYQTTTISSPSSWNNSCSGGHWR